MDLCINQMKNVLSSQQLPENASMEVIGRAYHATETIVQVHVCYVLAIIWWYCGFLNILLFLIENTKLILIFGSFLA